jgi:RHS repeat-associated protein
LTNSSGTVTDTYSYTAFGELFNPTGSTANSYLYTGQQFDALTGLYDLRARYYNPALGRFLSQDTYPVNFNNPVELNRYVYAANNPTNLTDPTGHTAYGERGLLNFFSRQNATTLIKVGIGITAVFLAVNALLPFVVPKIWEEPKIDVPPLPIEIRQPRQDPGEEPIPTVYPPPWRVTPQIPTPQTTPTKEPLKKHIALGISDYLGTFLGKLNTSLIKQNALAYISESWHDVGLSDVPASMIAGTFHIAFEQAITRAEHIHFNLQGISNPKEWAENHGKGDVYKDADYVTAWELYNIYHNSVALSKTTFYPDGFTSFP